MLELAKHVLRLTASDSAAGRTKSDASEQELSGLELVVGMDTANIRRLRSCFLLVDVGFVAYWSCVWLQLFPQSYLFKDYENPILQAWNVSFLPLDLLVTVSGLGSLWLQARRRAAWEVLALVSLSLTMCSGLQALAFWAIRDDYDLVWWAPNLFLLIYPLFFIVPCIARGMRRPAVTGAPAQPN